MEIMGVWCFFLKKQKNISTFIGGAKRSSNSSEPGAA
jgi:hypothetical protein